MKKTIMQYTTIAALVYIIVYMLSGLVVTFGRNPFNTTIRGLIYNFWTIGTVIISKEYIRYKIINNVYDKDKVKFAAVISIVYIIIEFKYTMFLGDIFPVYSFMKYILENTLPSIAVNVVFSYTAIHGNYIPAVIYRTLTNLYFWISPIIPNSPWIMKTIIDTTIPMVLFLYIRYAKNKFDYIKSRENIVNSDPKSIIPLIILIVLGVWFAVGVFPIKPVAVATGSMEKEICVGDVAIIKKCNANNVNVGDVIEYQLDDYTVIHRIIEKKQKQGEFYFVTKGDNNGNPDHNEVRENQLIGKVIYKIKYIGYPAIWLHILKVEDKSIGVETGK